MGDKQLFKDRLETLRLNVNAIKEVRIHLPTKQETIPNQEGKQGSLQIYAEITTNDGYISPKEAKRGLEIFGEELREEARQGIKHPNITILEDIVSSGSTIRVDVIREYNAKPIPNRIHEKLPEIIEKFGTPFHIYDEEGIRNTAKEFNNAFLWVDDAGWGVKNYFAVKALPNLSIVQILKEEGMGADCSANLELDIARVVNLRDEKLMFTSNNTPKHEFRAANNLGAIINFDDLTHIDTFVEHVRSLPEIACCRYNPGKLKKGNSIIGEPTEAKYGFTKEQLSLGYKKLKKLGIKQFGLHTMIASNELNPDYFVETARILFQTVKELSEELGIHFKFVNLGGGIGTPYKAEQKPVKLHNLAYEIKKVYDEFVKSGMPKLRVVMENGRMITGPHGFLVSKVLHVAKKYKDYVGLDACMADLMRPALYGAYHEITILGKEDSNKTRIYDVTGSLCENNDKFAINRPLPEIKEGDIAVIHNTGAHGHAMGFNYNSKLRGKEFLFRNDGKVEMIRRAETRDDYFATLSFPGSKYDLKL